MPTPLFIQQTGLVTSVGLDAPSACAAIRAKVSNATESSFIDFFSAAWLPVCRVPFLDEYTGSRRLVEMAAMAIEECLDEYETDAQAGLPLLLCVPRTEPARTNDADDHELLAAVESRCGLRRSELSSIVPGGSVAASKALTIARQWMDGGRCEKVLIAATDSMVSWADLQSAMADDRLLNKYNANGFIAGEGAAAIVVGTKARGRGVAVTGLGHGREADASRSAPVLGQALATAIAGALDEAGIAMHEIDLRISDAAGEQSSFRDAAFAQLRTLRLRRETQDLWHPAESCGETGSAAGLIGIIVATDALKSGYAPGPTVLAHFAGSAGERAAVVLRATEER